MKRYLGLFILFLILFTNKTEAVYNPAVNPNNRFGIHILERADLEDAAKLVNSSGGRWGYVTLVIRDDQRNLSEWIPFFKELRDKHLIPLVRIATHAEESVWVKPKEDDVAVWVNFLDNLIWPTKNRYVILYNEPNHAKEWGNAINPQEYAQISAKLIKELKVKSKDFFVLNAGFDLSAQNISGQTIDALWYLNEMDREVPGIFGQFDGWVSHAYPNPGFSASPDKIGRHSIVGYRFEQEYLKNKFNIEKKPVFVTETGWIISQNGISEDLAASYYQKAFESIWTDDNLIAVTPFLLNYPQSLFASFSWKDKDGNLRPQYGQVAGISKVEGRPELTPFSFFGKLMQKFKDPPEKLTSIPEPLF